MAYDKMKKLDQGKDIVSAAQFMFCILGRNREAEKSCPDFLKRHRPSIYNEMGTQRQHYELQLTGYLKITNADVVVKKYEYMNYNIQRKVEGG